MEDTHYKLVAVGDAYVGKTSMIITWTRGQFPLENIPTVFDNYQATITGPDGRTVAELDLWDTAGGEDYDMLRPLAYPGTQVFLVLFSLVVPVSLTNVKTKWVPEIKFHCPGIPIVLVGTKSDLRDDPETLKEMKIKELSPTHFNDGVELAKEVGAWAYCEISSLRKPKGLNKLFEFIPEVCKNHSQSQRPEVSAPKKKGFLRSFFASLTGKSDGNQLPPRAEERASAAAKPIEESLQIQEGFQAEGMLPDEVWVEVFRRMRIQDLGRVAAVSKRFKMLSEGDSLWTAFLAGPVDPTQSRPAKEAVKMQSTPVWPNPEFLPSHAR